MNRARYFGYRVILLVFYIILGLLLLYGGFDFISIFFKLLLIITLSVFGLSITVRRFHDLEKSGWFCLLGIVPLVNFITGLYLLFAPGTYGNNQYGEDPLYNSL